HSDTRYNKASLRQIIGPAVGCICGWSCGLAHWRTFFLDCSIRSRTPPSGDKVSRIKKLRGQKQEPRPTREATGDGEEGGCRLARVHEAGKPQWISGACQSGPPRPSCRLDRGPMWQRDG